ncbi:hypothetical protein RUE5091_00592 [Ruegeria denitrificans]|uniref:Uncharacterized protein n=1 Tax=Ruegeria denitrificans TaxID=1715692 RepID=A0A0P1I388_9RHOB|nr:hypothetical protein [Ruegeria denitrificans]CUJ87796.1 hypothetical protein RUE5091_00592 [Ruegeria denitrificans]
MKDQNFWHGIHVVCGFSSVGKSEYIRHLLTTPGPFLDATPVYEAMFGSKVRNALTSGDVFHLDISNDPSEARPNYTPDVNNHPIAAKGVFSQGITSVDFLIVPERILRERIRRRAKFSDDINLQRPDRAYPSAEKLRVLDTCPLVSRYSVWMDYFEARNVQIRYINSGNRSYREIAGRQSAQKILRNEDSFFDLLEHETRVALRRVRTFF